MSDDTVPGRIKPDLIENGTRFITARGKMESALLIVLMGTAAALSTTDIQATQPDHRVETTRYLTRSPNYPIVSVLSNYPNDVTTGFDTWNGWPPPEPPFIQAQTHVPLVLSLTSYAAYNPAPDIIYPQFRRKPDFEAKPPFIQARPFNLLNLQINPPPPGDLTTFFRRPAVFEDAKIFDAPDKGAWHVVLMPGLAPPPTPPPVDTGGVWPLPSAIIHLPGRGAWELPGGQQALWVFGNGCFLMTVATPAMGSTPATFAMVRVGTLSSNAGPVCIRDNGPGGFAVIVDGPNGYFYEIATRIFTKINDPAFLGATHVAFIDGWWVFNQPGTQVFYTTVPTYSTIFNGSYFALKDGATDKLVALIENKQELWLIGAKTTEIWYDAGGPYFAFQRLVSTMLQVGISAKYSLARYSAGGETGLCWLGLSERGENVVVKTQGFSVLTISTPAISNAISSYTVISDAIGYVYQADTHEFYVLIFPTADKTWVFDFATNLWHERLSYDPYAGEFHRHRSNCFLHFQNQALVGDYQNGAVHRLDRTAYTDAGWPLVAQRRTPHIWDDGPRNRVFMASLQIEFSPGVGNQQGMGYDPQAVLTISRDGGTTWGSELKRSMGKVGAYLNRVIWRKLSFSRDAVLDVQVSDPVNRDVVGATLRAASNDQ